MSFHHLAITTKDLAATHRFYTEAVGFTLAKVDVLDTPGGGWARHAFFDTGEGPCSRCSSSTTSRWANSAPICRPASAFRTGRTTSRSAPPTWTLGELHRHRLLAHGHGCVIMDHHEAISLYADDPNGILVELSTWVRPFFTRENRRRAADLIHAAAPTITIGEPPMEFFDPAPAPRSSPTSSSVPRAVASRLRVELSDQLLRRDGTVRVLADRRDLVPVDRYVEPNADPTPVADVRRTEEPVGLGLHEERLHARRRRTPEVRELVVVMTVDVCHHERRLVADEERRRAVARPLRRLGNAMQIARNRSRGLAAIG